MDKLLKKYSAMKESKYFETEIEQLNQEVVKA
jgi:hypothetical protein